MSWHFSSWSSHQGSSFCILNNAFLPAVLHHQLTDGAAPCTQTGAYGGPGGWTQRGDAPLHLIPDRNILSAFIKKQVQGLLWYLGVLSEGIWTQVEPTQQWITGWINSHHCTNFSSICNGWEPAAARMQPVPILNLYQLLGAQGLRLLQLRKECSDGLSSNMEAHGLCFFPSPHPVWPSSRGKTMWFHLGWQYSL